jgi:hypothetical protein
MATLAAIAWAAWSGRARGPEAPEDSVQAYERFRQALATPVPGSTAAPTPRPGRDTAPRQS